MENPTSLVYVAVFMQCFVNVVQGACGVDYKTLSSVWCYKLHKTQKTWNEAHRTCENEMATLFSLDTIVDQDREVCYSQRLDELVHKLGSTPYELWLSKVPTYLNWNNPSPREEEHVNIFDTFQSGQCLRTINNGDYNEIEAATCDQQYLFVCIRRQIPPSAIVDNSVGCPVGWFAHGAIANKCFRSGTGNRTRDKILSTCKESNSDMISQSSFMELSEFGVIRPDGECAKTDLTEPCTEVARPYMCEAISKPKIKVQISQMQTNYKGSTIWIQTSEKPTLKCNVTVDEQLVLPTENTSVQFEWIHNGLIIREWTTQHVTVHWTRTFSPLGPFGTMDNRLGTYQCQVRIHPLPGWFRSEKLTILSAGQQLFSLSMTLVVDNESVTKRKLSYCGKDALPFWIDKRSVSDSNDSFNAVFRDFSSIAHAQWMAYAIKVDWFKFEKLTKSINLSTLNLTLIISLSTNQDKAKQLERHLTDKFLNQILPGDYLVQSLLLTRNDMCESEHYPQNEPVFTWSPVHEQTVYTPKPPCISRCENTELERKCMTDFIEGSQWEPFDYSMCLDPRENKGKNGIQTRWGPPIIIPDDCNQTISTTESLQQLAQSDITNETAEKVSSQLWQIVQNSNNAIAPIDVSNIAIILQILSKEDIPHQKVVENVGHVVDHLMNLDQESIRKSNTSANRITESFERILSSANVQLNLASIYASSFTQNEEDRIVGVAAMINETTIASRFDSSNVVTFTQENNKDFRLQNADVAMFFASDLFLNHSERISLIIYENATLFPTDSRNVTVNSRVMSATVTSHNTTNIQQEPFKPLVKLIFQPLKPYKQSGGIHCVYWDNSSDSGRGNWSTKGCWLDSVHEGKVICYCDHLTNFAVLMGVSEQTTNMEEDHILSLSILTNVGCAISILGLSLTVITFALFKKWRVKLGNRVLCNLCMALLLVLVTFLGGIDQVHRPKACIFVTALLHFSLLATFCWMLVEAILQYLMFVRVFDSYVPRFMTKAMTFAWGTPLIIVIFCMSLKFDYYNGGHVYCWLQGEALYFAFLVPVGGIIVVNVVVFVMVIKGITCDRSNILRNNQSQYANIKKHLIAAVCIFLLLGLTWVFGFLVIITSTSVIFQYIFCICNSLQGALIFIFMVLRDKNAQDLWSSIIRSCHHTPQSKSILRTRMCRNQHRVLLHDETKF